MGIDSEMNNSMTKPMPGGAPVWRGDLKGVDLETLFGFVEATVTCPETLKVPLLPYKDPAEGNTTVPYRDLHGCILHGGAQISSQNRL